NQRIQQVIPLYGFATAVSRLNDPITHAQVIYGTGRSALRPPPNVAAGQQTMRAGGRDRKRPLMTQLRASPRQITAIVFRRVGTAKSEASGPPQHKGSTPA